MSKSEQLSRPLVPKVAPPAPGRKNPANCGACGFRLSFHTQVSPCVISLHQVRSR